MEALKKKIIRELDEQIEEFQDTFKQVFRSQNEQLHKSIGIRAVLEFLDNTDILTDIEIEPYDAEVDRLTEKIYRD